MITLPPVWAWTLAAHSNCIAVLPSPVSAKIASRPHPRKIFLTASPMEKRPSEVYTLAALANVENTISSSGTLQRLRRNQSK